MSYCDFSAAVSAAMGLSLMAATVLAMAASPSPAIIMKKTDCMTEKNPAMAFEL